MDTQVNAMDVIRTRDQEHLKLLSIFHYVLGGLAGLFALFPVFHLIFGLIFILAPQEVKGDGDVPPAFIGWIFVLFSAGFIVTGWIFAGCVIAAGRCLARQRRYLFCLVMAGIECIFMPLGTVLGVFTILVLMRETVKGLFEANRV